MTPEADEFPIGVHDFHPDASLDFQLNRLVGVGGGRLREVREVASRIADLDDWKREFLALAETAVDEERFGNAAAYCRAAEFNMAASDPDKPEAYRRQVQMHRRAYAEDYESGVVSTGSAPFGDDELPYWRFPSPPSAGRTSGPVVLHGGFDSYGEELYPAARALARLGHETVLFEGPGQGAVIREQGLPFTQDWHRPVAAVLDDLQLDDVSLIGLSLGGCLALRAAAVEARVTRVVAWDVMWDMFAVIAAQMPLPKRFGFEGLVRMRAGRILDRVVEREMRTSLIAQWAIDHGTYVTGVSRPSQYFQAMRRLTTRDISADVTQDVLLLAGSDDHYVPLDHLDSQVSALTRARSVTSRIFTAAEHAGTHCQVGNAALAIRTIAAWLDERTRGV